MTSNKNEDEIVGISHKNIRQDILLFKEEVLKDIKVVQREFSNKFSKMEDILKEQILAYELKVSNFEERMKNLSNSFSFDRSILQKIDDFVKFKEDTNDKLLTDSIKINNIESDYKLNLKNIERVLSSSVIYPRLIGYSGKFKTFHNYMDYVLNQIDDLNAFKERNVLDLVPYKKKIEETLEYIKLQIDHIISSCNQFTIKSVNDCEQRMKSLIQLYDDRLQDTRVENAHYSVGLQKKSEELSSLIKDMYEIKIDLNQKFKEQVANIKGDQRTLVRLFTSYKKEFRVIKDKFIQLSEFIRDVRFRVNIAPDVHRKEFIAISKKLDFSRDKSENKNKLNKAEAYSLNKKYFNNNYDIFDSPYINPQTKFLSNSFNNYKRKSLQVGNSYKFGRKVINKFENSILSKEESKNKKSSDNSLSKLGKVNINKNNIGILENIILNSNENLKNKVRRNTTAISISNKFNKEFSDFNQNFISSINNDLFKKKENGDNSLYSSQSSSNEDKSKTEKKERETSLKLPLKVQNNNEKNHDVIKEEDENNNSEITEDNKKRKSNKDNKSLNKEKKHSIINNKNELNANSNGKSDEKSVEINKGEKKEINDKGQNKEQKKETNDKGQNKEEKKEINELANNEENFEVKEKNKNETEVIKDNKAHNNNIDISNKKNIIIKNNNRNNIILKSNNYSTKIFNKDDKMIKLQANKNELSERMKKITGRNNNISFVSINDIFFKDNKIINKQMQTFNSPNYLFTQSLENKYLKVCLTSERQEMKNKSNPSLLSKSSKIWKESTPINNIGNNTKINRNYFDNNDVESIEGIGFKTYTNFPQFGLEGYNAKTKLNAEIINIEKGRSKKKIVMANKFLNKKIIKANVNKGVNRYNNYNDTSKKIYSNSGSSRQINKNNN